MAECGARLSENQAPAHSATPSIHQKRHLNKQKCLYHTSSQHVLRNHVRQTESADMGQVSRVRFSLLSFVATRQKKGPRTFRGLRGQNPIVLVEQLD